MSNGSRDQTQHEYCADLATTILNLATYKVVQRSLIVTMKKHDS